jgi:hypothetical protein
MFMSIFAFTPHPENRARDLNRETRYALYIQEGRELHRTAKYVTMFAFTHTLKNSSIRVRYRARDLFNSKMSIRRVT